MAWRHATSSSVLMGAAALAAIPALAQGITRITMIAGDMPLPHGQPNQAFEDLRFAGYKLFDRLVAREISSAEKPSEIIPGLTFSRGAT